MTFCWWTQAYSTPQLTRTANHFTQSHRLFQSNIRKYELNFAADFTDTETSEWIFKVNLIKVWEISLELGSTTKAKRTLPKFRGIPELFLATPMHDASIQHWASPFAFRGKKCLFPMKWHSCAIHRERQVILSVVQARHIRGFDTGWRAVLFWPDVKIPQFGSMPNFEADVKKTTARHQRENRHILGPMLLCCKGNDTCRFVVRLCAITGQPWTSVASPVCAQVPQCVEPTVGLYSKRSEVFVEAQLALLSFIFVQPSERVGDLFRYLSEMWPVLNRRSWQNGNYLPEVSHQPWRALLVKNLLIFCSPPEEPYQSAPPLGHLSPGTSWVLGLGCWD